MLSFGECWSKVGDGNDWKHKILLWHSYQHRSTTVGLSGTIDIWSLGTIRIVKLFMNADTSLRESLWSHRLIQPTCTSPTIAGLWDSNWPWIWMQIQTPSLSPGQPPLCRQEGRAPHWQPFLRGRGVVGCIFLQPWRSCRGNQIVPTLRSVWTNSQIQILVFYLESNPTQILPASQLSSFLLSPHFFNLTYINFAVLCSTLIACIRKEIPGKKLLAG